MNITENGPFIVPLFLSKDPPFFYINKHPSLTVWNGTWKKLINKSREYNISTPIHALQGQDTTRLMQSSFHVHPCLLVKKQNELRKKVQKKGSSSETTKHSIHKKNNTHTGLHINLITYFNEQRTFIDTGIRQTTTSRYLTPPVTMERPFDLFIVYRHY